MEPLIRQLDSATARFGEPYEVVIVDDGSTDGTSKKVLEWQRKFFWLKMVRLSRRQGQTDALRTGFRHSSGEAVVVMDADLQYDPADIPRLLDEFRHGWDVVSGWRKERKDSASRLFQARCFRAGVRALFGVTFQDMGSGLKVYRRTALDAIPWRHRAHQYALLLALKKGFRVTEVPIHHRERPWGLPKYGWNRLLTVPLDLARIYCQKR